MSAEDYRRSFVDQLERSLALIPITDDDSSAMEAAMNDERPLNRDAGPFEKYFSGTGQPAYSPTVGYWSYFLRLLVGRIDYFSSDLVRNAANLRYSVRESEDQFSQLLDSAAAIAIHYSEAEIDFSGQPAELALGHACLDHAKELLTLCEADLAYNFSTYAIDFLRNTEDFGEQATRFALSLAEKTGRKHQIAACSFYLAHAVRNIAVGDPTRRAEAFELSEIAIGRLEGVGEPFLSECRDQLWSLFTWTPPETSL